MSDLQTAFFAKRARLNRLEKKELPELTRIRREMESLAKKGSVADQKNLPFIEQGIKRAQDEITHIKAWIAQNEGSFGNVWIQKAEKLDS